jgi:hypothetical protein
MATKMENYGIDNFLRDAKSLAKYKPRHAAISLIESSSIDAFLDWDFEDGRQAAFGETFSPPSPDQRWVHLCYPMFLDVELYHRHVHFESEQDRYFLARNGLKLVELWMAPPLEILLRRGTIKQFADLISQLTEPEIKSQDPDISGQIANAWRSLGPRLLAFGQHHWRYKDAVIGRNSLLLLALSLGKLDFADAMVKHEACPIYWETWDDFRVSTHEFFSLSNSTLNKVVGMEVSERTKSRATHWIEKNAG